jgi:hypothetical protein
LFGNRESRLTRRNQTALVRHGPRDFIAGLHCVLADTLPKVPARFAKRSQDRRPDNESVCGGEFGIDIGGCHVGGVWASSKVAIWWEATTFCGRCVGSFAASGLVGFVGLGTSRCDAARGNSNSAEGNHGQAGAATGPCSRPTIGHSPRCLPAGAIATRGCARRHCAVLVSGRRSDPHHRSRLRPQQGAGDGADGHF